MIERLRKLLEPHVGGQLAVWKDGEIHDVVTGVLNTATGQRATPDSLFQIASITKVFTATLVQELVNDGLLDLDRPVRDLFPFRPDVTPRHLLSHTGGFEGDLFFDTGTADDAIEKFVARLADEPQISPPGAFFSYCNSGYVVLGRIVEVLRGKPFNAVLKELAPYATTTCAEAAARESAVGHQKGEPVTDPGPESDWPAGSALAMSARDLVGFARMHLETRAFDAMREPQVTTPDGRSQWGLGWMLLGDVIGHNGGNVGLDSYLLAVPSMGVVVAALTNGGDPGPLHRALYRELLPELAGVDPPGQLKPPADPKPVDTDKVCGVYRSAGHELHVTPGDKGVKVRFEPRNTLTATLTGTEREYVALKEDLLIAVDEPHSVLTLLGEDDGRYRWLHYGRAATRL